MNFDHLAVRSKLTYSFGVMLLMLMIVAGTGYNGMRSANTELHNIVDINVNKIFLLNEMSSSVHIVSRVIRSIALLHDDNEIAAQKVKIADARKQYDEALASLEKLPLDEKGKKFVDEIKTAAGESRALNNKFVDLSKSDPDAAIKLMMTDGLVAMNKWQGLLLEFSELQIAKNKAEEASVEASYQSSILFMAVLTVLALVGGVAISVLLTRSILRQIGCEPDVAIGIAHKITEGDLTVKTNARAGDDYSLLYSIEKMRESLADMVTQVKSTADGIALSSKEISVGNLDLSARTEHQAATLEETASSMEELTSTVKQNSDNAQQANALSKSASTVAVKGGEVVSQVISTMDLINSSSKKIVDIISVIDGIAFQTNILALNAAVEAARAGEQGRGFAVVASEVRNLAQRSASAAKEVKALIDDSVEKVEFGSKLVNQAGVTMNEVVNSVNQVTNIISEIAAASREQNQGIEQINQTVMALDDVTQQNAALVEQVAAASNSLNSQTTGLVMFVDLFKVDTRTGTDVRRHVRASAEPATAVAKTTKKPVAISLSKPGTPKPSVAYAKPAMDQGWEEF